MQSDYSHLDGAETYWSPAVREHPRRPRVLAGSLAVLYALLLAAFALPWVTISCDTAQTKALSGYDLALRTDPEIRGSTDSEAFDDIMDAVTGLRRIAGVVLILTLATAFLASRVAFSSTSGTRPAGVLLLLATMTAHGFVAFLYGSWELFGADTHHHAGFGFAFALAIIGALLALPLGPASRQDPIGRKVNVASMVAVGFAIFLALAMYPLASASPAGGVFVIVACVLAWILSAMLTLREPTARSGIGLIVSGAPLALIGGLLLGS
jgi:hypothetical protein